MKQTGLDHRVFQISEGIANIPHPLADEFEKGLRAKHNVGMWYPRVYNQMHMLAAAITKAKSTDPKKIGAALEGAEFDVFNGGKGFMRADDHQFFQPIYLSSFGSLKAGDHFDEEKTGWGWRMIAKVETADTNLPTTCKMQRPN